MSRTHKDKKRWKMKQWLNLDIDDRDLLLFMGMGSIFRRIGRKERRAKEKAAVRTGREVPLFKKSDRYDWL